MRVPIRIAFRDERRKKIELYLPRLTIIDITEARTRAHINVIQLWIIKVPLKKYFSRDAMR